MGEDVELLLWGLVISKSSSSSSSSSSTSSEVLDVKDQPKRMRELSRKYSRKYGSRASIIPSDDAKTDDDGDRRPTHSSFASRRRSSVRSNISSFDSFSTADDGIGSDDDDERGL